MYYKKEDTGGDGWQWSMNYYSLGIIVLIDSVNDWWLGGTGPKLYYVLDLKYISVHYYILGILQQYTHVVAF